MRMILQRHAWKVVVMVRNLKAGELIAASMKKVRYDTFDGDIADSFSKEQSLNTSGTNLWYYGHGEKNLAKSKFSSG